MSDGATTLWDKAIVGEGTAKYLRNGAWVLWSRLMNGELFFAALPKGVTPVNGSTVGYHGIDQALKAEGLYE